MLSTRNGLANAIALSACRRTHNGSLHRNGSKTCLSGLPNIPVIQATSENQRYLPFVDRLNVGGYSEIVTVLFITREISFLRNLKIVRTDHRTIS